MLRTGETGSPRAHTSPTWKEGDELRGGPANVRPIKEIRRGQKAGRDVIIITTTSCCCIFAVTQPLPDLPLLTRRGDRQTHLQHSATISRDSFRSQPRRLRPSGMALPRGRASARPPYAHRPCPIDSDSDRHCHLHCRRWSTQGLRKS